MTTNLLEEVQGAGDLNRQLGLLRPAFRNWKTATAEADESAAARLNRILSAIYAFGLDALADKAAFRKVGKDCQITLPGDSSDKNWWLPIVKIACGDFHPTQTVIRNHPSVNERKVELPAFIPGETLARYAVALRALEKARVAPNDVESYVNAFRYESGTVKMGRWNGIIASDRAARKASGQTTGRKMHDTGKLQAAANALLARCEVPAEVKAKASAAEAKFVMMWGLETDGVFVPGGRVEGDTYEAKAKTLASEFATRAEQEAKAQEPVQQHEPDFDVVVNLSVEERLRNVAETSARLMSQ